MYVKKRELGARFRPTAAATQLLPRRTALKTTTGRLLPVTGGMATAAYSLKRLPISFHTFAT